MRYRIQLASGKSSEFRSDKTIEELKDEAASGLIVVGGKLVNMLQVSLVEPGDDDDD